MVDLQKTPLRLWLAFGIFATVLMAVSPPALAQQQYDGSLWSGLRWRMIGPFRGGRVNAVGGVLGQPNTF